jgi:hypothetical protein
MISRGGAAANQEMAARYGFPFPILLQDRWEVSRLYRSFAIPGACRIDGEGRLASDVVSGAAAVERLIAAALTLRSGGVRSAK